MTETKARPIHILLVEDDPGDVRLTIEAFKKSRFNSLMSVVNDGAEALQYLRRERPYAAAPLPDLILLDLNLPRLNGHEVLKEIKDDARLKHIPVVVLSGSTSAEDIRRAYDTHANCYVTKPSDWELYSSAIGAIEDFWLDFVKLPGAD